MFDYTLLDNFQIDLTVELRFLQCKLRGEF